MVPSLINYNFGTKANSKCNNDCFISSSNGHNVTVDNSDHSFALNGLLPCEEVPMLYNFNFFFRRQRDKIS
jgi:hypothetical protein